MQMHVVADEFYEAVDTLQLQENVDSNMHAVDESANVAAVAGDQNFHRASVENNSILEVGSTDIVNSVSDSRLSSDLPPSDVQCLSKDSMSQDDFVSNSISQPTDGASADVSVESQPQHTADNNIQTAKNGETWPDGKEAVESDDVTEVEATDDDYLQQIGSQLASDADQLEQVDKATFENGQQISCTLLPMYVAEEPSTADSNEDFAEFVEASTSLNPDSAGELCVDSLPVTSVETQQSEMATDAEQRLEESGNTSIKDEKECIGSSSAVSLAQPGNEFAGNSSSQPFDSTLAGDNVQSQQSDTTDSNEQVDSGSTQLQSIQAVDSDEVSGVECTDNSASEAINAVFAADNDNVQSHQHDAAVDMQADSDNTQSEITEALVSDSVSGVEEAAADDLLQSVDSQLHADVGQSEQLNNAACESENAQQASCTALPLPISEEPSTADSNDDFTEFVEASTSLNLNSAGELCVDTLSATSVENPQSETGTDAEQQSEEDGDADDNDEEPFVDSSSDISPTQPVEGKC